MRIPGWLRWLVGAASIWPIVWFVIVAVAVVRTPVHPIDVERGDAHGLLEVIDGRLVAFTMVAAAFMIGFCFWHLARSQQGRTPKAVWVLVLLMCGPFGYPIYWWARIRPSPINYR